MDGKLFLSQNRSVVMISFQQLTALPYVCIGQSLLFHLGVGVSFLDRRGYGSCFIPHASQHIWTQLVFSADYTETNLLSQARIHWLEIRCWSQQATVHSRNMLVA